MGVFNASSKRILRDVDCGTWGIFVKVLGPSSGGLDRAAGAESETCSSKLRSSTGLPFSVTLKSEAFNPCTGCSLLSSTTTSSMTSGTETLNS